MIFHTGYYKGYYQTEYFQRQLALTNQSSLANNFNSSLGENFTLFYFIFLLNFWDLLIFVRVFVLRDLFYVDCFPLYFMFIKPTVVY